MSTFSKIVKSTAITCAFALGTSAHADGIEKAGDALQIILPVAAAVCAQRNGDLAAYSGRFAGQLATTYGLKYGLGSRQINQRPNGASHGFPSSHTAAAVYGASYLSRRCLDTPGQKALVYGLAAFVGASRIHANKHTVAQVAAGALVGYMFDNVSVNFTNSSLSVGWRMEF